MLEIYFETYGCTANYNSSEIMKGIVKQAGLNLTSDPDYADIIVINSCIVKEPTEEKIRKKFTDYLADGKKVILAGCMPRINEKKLQKENLYLLDTSQSRRIAELIKDIMENSYDQEKYLKKRNEIKADLPKVSKEKYIGITQISEGCQGTCAYCIVRIAKGPLFSYPKEKIIESIKKDISAGCKEIWITSQDNAAYGNESGQYLLPELLKEILELKGDFYVRVGMMNPNNVLPILGQLIEIYKHKKMFKFLHIPIQSGSDNILSEMNRKYVREDVQKIVKEFRKQIPNLLISTDIIVGYPGETEKDFWDTLKLYEEISPEIVNPSNYYHRSGTPASSLEKLDPKIVKERSTELIILHKKICKELQELYENWEGKVLIDSKGYGNTYLGRMIPEYKLVAIQSNENILGKIVNARVEKVTPHYLIASLKI